MHHGVDAIHKPFDGHHILQVADQPFDGRRPLVAARSGQRAHFNPLRQQPRHHELPDDARRAGYGNAHGSANSRGTGLPSNTACHRSIKGFSKCRLGWSFCQGFSYW